MQQQKSQKHILVVGAGPGGLTAAMILAFRGFKVTVVEKEAKVGGRNASIERGGYKFDTGPTFLMMKFLLDEVFEEAGKNLDDYVECTKLEPMYRLQFKDRAFEPTTEREAMLQQMDACFPGSRDGYDKFMEVEKERYESMYACLQKDYNSWTRYFSLDVLKALPKLSVGRSIFEVLGDYFEDDKLKLSFTFQSKYLGMSAWDCPGAFALLPYIEHAFGVWHTKGGLSEISEAMGKVCEEHGVDIRLGSPAKQLLLEGRKVCGAELADGEKIHADEIVLNADFAYAMKNLVPPGTLKKYSPQKVDKKEYSCSTFMLYLGVDKIYDLPHHTIFFAEDYKTNIEEIFKVKKLSKDLSLYVRNASATDPTLAPEGHSAIYVLVPVPNLTAPIDWEESEEPFREQVIRALETTGGMTDLREHIKEEIVYSPKTWESMNINFGATFNLAHCLKQMMYLRPRNKFEELDNCYLVGGGTHPGSGLPMIYESGRIAANLISRHHKVPFTSKNLQVQPN